MKLRFTRTVLSVGRRVLIAGAFAFVLVPASLAAAATATSTTSTTAGSVPNPGLGTAPPGTDGLNTILGWVMGVVVFACVAGALFTAGKMALQHRRGEGGEALASLGWVFGACILAGSASALVGALVV